MYCRSCSYSLRGLTKHRCPECGTPFDPDDRRTFRRSPVERRLHAGARVFTWLLLLWVAFLAATNIVICALGAESFLEIANVYGGGFVAAVLALEAAFLHAGAQRPPSPRLIAVLVVLTILWLAVPGTHWPFRAQFGWYRSDLDALAQRLEAGGAVQTPLQVGSFVIRRAELDPRGFACLWTFPAPGGNTGLVRCVGYRSPPFNLRSSHALGGGWFMIVED